MWVVNSTPRPLYPRERVWVGLIAGLDRCGKSRLSAGFDPRTVQPVANCYTDYVMPAPCVLMYAFLILLHSCYIPYPALLCMHRNTSLSVITGIVTVTGVMLRAAVVYRCV
jgi:hypothetical protein